MFHLVLYQPEIPGNTGNIIRLAANTGATLHLIHPLGFSTASSQLKRAGLDYHELAQVFQHTNFEAFLEELAPTRLWVFTCQGRRLYTEAGFTPGDALVFGPETTGLPESVITTQPTQQRLYLPMQPGNRSLNLANAVAISLFEAWRQSGFEGATSPQPMPSFEPDGIGAPSPLSPDLSGTPSTDQRY